MSRFIVSAPSIPQLLVLLHFHSAFGYRVTPGACVVLNRSGEFQVRMKRCSGDKARRVHLPCCKGGGPAYRIVEKHPRFIHGSPEGETTWSLLPRPTSKLQKLRRLPPSE